MRPSPCTAEAAAYVAAILAQPCTTHAECRAQFGPGYVASVELRAEAEALYGTTTRAPLDSEQEN